MYELNSSTVSGLAPDVIVVQDSCRICAVSPDALSCSTLDCKVVTLCPKTLPDVLANVVEVAEALGHRQRGLDFVGKMQHRLDRLPRPSSPRNVCVLEWIDPLMSCGYWIPEIIARGGGCCVPPTAAGAHTAYITISEIMTASPQHVFVAACGFDVRRCAQEIVSASSASREALRRILDAGIAVWIADGNRFFNRSGPGVVESAVMVAQAIGGGKQHALPGEPNLYNAEGFLSLTDALALIDAAVDSVLPSSSSSSSSSSSVPSADAATATTSALESGGVTGDALSDAVQGAKAVVLALRQGDVAAAWKQSSVSSCMSLHTYTTAIVSSTDYAPLSNPEHQLEWGADPETLGESMVKVSLKLLPAKEATQDTHVTVTTVAYDFRMEFFEGKWMVKGVFRHP
eukprot:Tamp_07529.p1 GENE.Tamp_07529~~Tamp_07529.p1  ORF type:complete len:471 (+),score=78.13 Tamp_07529:212-1414(+)